MATTDNILKLTQDSAIIASHINCRKVQDAYSLRCVPQVHDASKEALQQAARTLSIEINAVTDNPIIMPNTGEVFLAVTSMVSQLPLSWIV